jgi:hypothetical protein
MDRLLGLVTIASLCLVGLVLYYVRRAHIRVEYSVSWFLAAVALLALASSRGALERLSAALGIEYAPVALLLVIVFVFSLVLFRLSIIISNLKDSNIALAQRVAILEFQIHSLHEAQQTPAGR